jgi:type I restriction enzyme R subunit
MAMYVDKRLDGMQAVQTLSRLNRMVPGKEEPFVLDFVNEAEDIYRAFKPYFDATSLQESSDPALLEQLKHALDGFQVYHWSEVEAFARIFYRTPNKQNPADHAHLQRHLQPAVDRFKAMEDEEQRGEFRDKLSGYVKVYSFLSQIIPYADPDLEMLYSFGRLLLPHLPLERDTGVVKLGDEVGLQYYRLQRVFSGAIELREGEGEYGGKEPYRCRYRQGQGRKGTAVGDHRGVDRPFWHQLHRRGPPLFRADQGEGDQKPRRGPAAKGQPLRQIPVGPAPDA